MLSSSEATTTGFRALSSSEKTVKLPRSIPPPSNSLSFHYQQFSVTLTNSKEKKNKKKNQSNRNDHLVCCCSIFSDFSAEELTPTPITTSTTTKAPVVKKRKIYRKQYPGESKGITEEMRFIDMELRNSNFKDNNNSIDEKESRKGKEDAETWQPSMKGFLKYLVDSKLVFNTLDRIFEESNHVDYAYFRKTGLERSEGLSKDLEWFKKQDIAIPQSSTHGVSYAKYLEKLAKKCAPSFLCHFYNIYFAHIAGGQVIANQVSEKLLEGRELEFYRWEGDASELLKDVRQKLNKLGEHWSRDVKNKCLRESAKSFRFLGQIVRLIVL